MSTIEVRRVVRAPTEALWAAWTDPRELTRWYVDTASGAAEPGGTMAWGWDGFGDPMPLTVEAAEAPRRLALAAGPAQRYEILLEPVAAGTRTTVRHGPWGSDALSVDVRLGCESGWTLALASLATYLERYPGRDRRHWFAARAIGEIDYRGLLAGRFATPEVREPWLPECADGAEVARTAREVMLDWDAIDGVLTLKAYATGPGTHALALAASSWGPAPALDVQGVLERGLDRLLASL